MNTLEDQVKALKAGDKIRAIFRDPAVGEYTIEATTRGLSGDRSTLWVGLSLLRLYDNSPYEDLISVEVLEPAAVAFYTNAPADRKPREGDVFEYEGLRWQVGIDGTSRCENGFGSWPLGRWTPRGVRLLAEVRRLALVDPAELAEEEVVSVLPNLKKQLTTVFTEHWLRAVIDPMIEEYVQERLAEQDEQVQRGYDTQPEQFPGVSDV